MITLNVTRVWHLSVRQGLGTWSDFHERRNAARGSLLPIRAFAIVTLVKQHIVGRPSWTAGREILYIHGS